MMSPEQYVEQQDILDHGRGLSAYIFAVQVADADVESLQNIIINKGSAHEAYVFARDVAGSNAEKLAEVILDRGDAMDASLFAVTKQNQLDVKTVQKLQDMVLAEGNPSTLYFFARMVENANLDQIADVIVTHDPRISSMSESEIDYMAKGLKNGLIDYRKKAKFTF